MNIYVILLVYISSLKSSLFGFILQFFEREREKKKQDLEYENKNSQ